MFIEEDEKNNEDTKYNLVYNHQLITKFLRVT